MKRRNRRRRRVVLWGSLHGVPFGGQEDLARQRQLDYLAHWEEAIRSLRRVGVSAAGAGESLRGMMLAIEAAAVPLSEMLNRIRVAANG